LGFDVKYCDVRPRQIPGGYSDGITHGGNVRNEAIIGKGREVVFPLLVSYMAGVAAESLAGDADAMSRSRTVDLQNAWQFAVMAMCEIVVVGERGTVTPAEQEAKEPLLRAALEDAKSEAVRLVRENFEAVNRIAETLLRRRRIPGDEIVSLIKSCRPDVVIPPRSLLLA
jgi:ATP-dependent Zn protease